MDLKDKQTTKNKHFSYSLDFAISGLKVAFKEERNLRFHICSLIAVCLLGMILKLSLNEWLWILLSAVLVIVAELANTALENTVDMVTNYHFHPLGKKVKDIGAGMVLVQALFALIVGCFILVPKLYHLFF